MSGDCFDGSDTPVRSSAAWLYWASVATAARSRHPGGVNVCMVDGSVHFVSNNIDINVRQALISADRADVASGIANPAERNAETAPSVE